MAVCTVLTPNPYIPFELALIPLRQKIHVTATLLFLGLFLVFCLSRHSATAAESADSLTPLVTADIAVPEDKVLIANGATIGTITFHIGDVFDLSNPKENKSLFRLANKLHINTREYVVDDQLLFRPGDLYTPQLLRESERILRSNIYLYDAEIRPVRYENNQVDLEVRTRDVWTLTGGVNYSHKGGETSYGFDIEEKNFLGLGKTVQVKRHADEFRTQNEFAYYDPFMGHNRFQLLLGYSDNSDGRLKEVKFERPFYSLDTRWSMGLNAKTYTRTEYIYENGEVAERFVQEDQFYNATIGFSRGYINNYTARWVLGYSVESNDFRPLSDTNDATAIPADRELTYPWLQYSSVHTDYIKTQRVNQIQRTEDINLGNVYSIRLGWSDESLGADRNALIFNTDYGSANRTFSQQMLLVNLSGSGRIGKDFSENLLLQTQARYFYPVFDRQVFYTELSFDAGHNMDKDKQLLLGGESGLRGYPSRIQSGNRRLLFRTEQRYYTDLHVLQLIHVAGAVFFDIGRAWTPGATAEKHDGFLKDAGIGLRFESSRSGSGAILHADIAYALDADEDIKKLQFLVSTESRF